MVALSSAGEQSTPLSAEVQGWPGEPSPSCQSAQRLILTVLSGERRRQGNCDQDHSHCRVVCAMLSFVSVSVNIFIFGQDLKEHCMSEKEKRQSQISEKVQRQPEKPVSREIADDELEQVTGGIGSTGGVGSTSSVCVSLT